MPTSRYRPFEEPLSDVKPDELSRLSSVAEGWHVEYKREALPVKGFAKSLAAFANHYGGWLFIGIEQAQDESNTAGKFTGIPNENVPSCLESLRNASKDALVPHVYYLHKIFSGPIESIGLPSGRSIIGVEIPQGPNPPYIHSDGRVYRRIADSSDPKPETDRHVLDRLWERGRQANDKLAEAITRTPQLSADEEDLCYLNLSIYSDPLGAFGHFYKGEFSTFRELMVSPQHVKFDNIFSRTDGFVARQIGTNHPRRRILTWEFSRRCTSFVTVPINHVNGNYEKFLGNYRYFPRFAHALKKYNISDLRILDLNIMLDALAAITIKHRKLVALAGVSGPFFCKAHIVNAWRAIPFVNADFYIKQIEQTGLPIVQDENILAPPGTTLESFVNLPMSDVSQMTNSDTYIDAGKLALAIFSALGIPAELLVEGVEELLTARSQVGLPYRL